MAAKSPFAPSTPIRPPVPSPGRELVLLRGAWVGKAAPGIRRSASGTAPGAPWCDPRSWPVGSLQVSTGNRRRCLSPALRARVSSGNYRQVFPPPVIVLSRPGPSCPATSSLPGEAVDALPKPGRSGPRRSADTGSIPSVIEGRAAQGSVPPGVPEKISGRDCPGCSPDTVRKLGGKNGGKIAFRSFYPYPATGSFPGAGAGFCSAVPGWGRRRRDPEVGFRHCPGCSLV